MVKKITCIICPNGCSLSASVDENGRIGKINGAGCIRGEAYFKQELTDPRRTIATSVPVEGGELPLCSVRATCAIPKAAIPEAIGVIRKIRLTAPVEAGTVLVHGLLGYESDVITTKNIARSETK